MWGGWDGKRRGRSVISTVGEARKGGLIIYTVSNGKTEINCINVLYVRRTLSTIEEVYHSHHYSAENC